MFDFDGFHHGDSDLNHSVFIHSVSILLKLQYCTSQLLPFDAQSSWKLYPLLSIHDSFNEGHEVLWVILYESPSHLRQLTHFRLELYNPFMMLIDCTENLPEIRRILVHLRRKKSYISIYTALLLRSIFITFFYSTLSYFHLNWTPHVHGFIVATSMEQE